MVDPPVFRDAGLTGALGLGAGPVRCAGADTVCSRGYVPAGVGKDCDCLTLWYLRFMSTSPDAGTDAGTGVAGFLATGGGALLAVGWIFGVACRAGSSSGLSVKRP